MYPEVLHLGFLHLRSYGLMMAVAFLVGTFLGLREARRLSLDEDKVVNVILITLIASVLGARMLYVLEHLPEFRREWTSVLALWQGGLTLYGGIVAGTFVGLVAAKRMGLPVWITADALTPSLARGTMFGRIGCFLIGCCYGGRTPLRSTRSPDLHRAGAAALGLDCESHAVRTPLAALGETLARLAAEGYTGCNLTMPLKEAALAHVREATPAARRARSVNTVTFLAAGSVGDTTDGAGFVDFLASLDRAARGTRVVLLGAGGAARSL